MSFKLEEFLFFFFFFKEKKMKIVISKRKSVSHVDLDMEGI
jgi:hypothetical protein